MEDSLLCTKCFITQFIERRRGRRLTIFGAHLRIIGEVVLLYLITVLYLITPVLLLKTQDNTLTFIVSLGDRLTDFWSGSHSKELFTVCVVYFHFCQGTHGVSF